MKTITGLLELNEDNDLVVNIETENEQNISKLLEHNWKYEIPATYTIDDGRKLFTSEECILQLKKNKVGIYDYYSESTNIIEKLLNVCGKHIEFTITTGR